MNVLKIEGGAPLVGSVAVGGSKNASLAILASLPLIDGVTELANLPNISDVRTKLELLREFGAEVSWNGSTCTIDTRNLHYFEPSDAHVRRIRTSFYLLGPLLTRFGKARLPMPGGCDIGDRKVDFHLKALASMGAPVDTDNAVYSVASDSLHGEYIYLDFPSAGATQHLMATACRTPGQTVIDNAAMEPEVTQLAAFLQGAGARIEGAGTNKITVTGVDHMGDNRFRIPADRIQVGTYLLAGAITKGRVTCTEILPEYQAALVTKLKEMGADVEVTSDTVTVRATGRLQAAEVVTLPYPGFATDMQQTMVAVMALADGTSEVDETIYERRTGHVNQLNRMGANIKTSGSRTIIRGVERLQGAVVEASDLRAGAALVLAGLAAEGTTLVHNVHYIDRGYEDFEATLNSLGASVERLSDTATV